MNELKPSTVLICTILAILIPFSAVAGIIYFAKPTSVPVQTSYKPKITSEPVDDTGKQPISTNTTQTSSHEETRTKPPHVNEQSYTSEELLSILDGMWTANTDTNSLDTLQKVVTNFTLDHGFISIAFQPKLNKYKFTPYMGSKQRNKFGVYLENMCLEEGSFWVEGTKIFLKPTKCTYCSNYNEARVDKNASRSVMDVRVINKTKINLLFTYENGDIELDDSAGSLVYTKKEG